MRLRRLCGFDQRHRPPLRHGARDGAIIIVPCGSCDEAGRDRRSRSCINPATGFCLSWQYLPERLCRPACARPWPQCDIVRAFHEQRRWRASSRDRGSKGMGRQSFGAQDKVARRLRASAGRSVAGDGNAAASPPCNAARICRAASHAAWPLCSTALAAFARSVRTGRCLSRHVPQTHRICRHQSWLGISRRKILRMTPPRSWKKGLGSSGVKTK